MNEENPLQAVSTVIELKPGHKYLLLFKGDITMEQVNHATAVLRASGIECFGFAMGEGVDLDVIEVPDEPKEQA